MTNSAFSGFLYSSSLEQAQLWSASSSSPTDLGTLPDSDRDIAHGMSHSGSVIVGWARETGNTRLRGWVWTSGGGIVDLETAGSDLQASRSAYGISGNGLVIVGFASTDSGSRFCSWTEILGQWEVSVASNVPNFSSRALDANYDGSVIVGWLTPSGGGSRALRYAGGTFTEIISSIPSRATAVDDSGDIVVGYYEPTTTSGNHAFIWTPDGNVIDLNDVAVVPSGYTLREATGISADGSTIVGNVHTGTHTRGFVLKPFVAVSPFSIVTTVGEEFEGDETSVSSSDNERYSAFNDNTSLECEIEVEGQFTVSTANQLRFTVELSVARAGLAYLHQLYKFSTSSWVNGVGATAPLVDTTATTTRVSDALGFFDSNHKVKARIQFSPINDEDPSLDGWLHSIDFVEWRKLG